MSKRDYSTAKIYRIVTDCDDTFYIGSTASKKYTKHTYLEFSFVHIETLDI